MLYLCESLADYDDEEYLRDFYAASPQRRRHALSYACIEDRKRCIKAYTLLAKGVQREYGLDSCPEFAFGTAGKPFFPEHPLIHFSLSHCGHAVACLVGRAPVGVDVEDVGSFDEQLVESAFSEEEAALIVGSPCPDRELARLWTRKESYAKMTGWGFSSLDQVKGIPTTDGAGWRFSSRLGKAGQTVCSACSASRPWAFIRCCDLDGRISQTGAAARHIGQR